MSISLIDEIITGTSTPGQSGPESNGKEGVLDSLCNLSAVYFVLVGVFGKPNIVGYLMPILVYNIY